MGQHDIGKKKFDIVALLKPLQRGFAILRLDDIAAELDQEANDQFPDIRIVLDHQHGSSHSLRRIGCRNAVLIGRR
jgi:hypothetical protein